jgi:uncharacterized protein YfcZ (UPF0381/DUF406 family)
MKVTVDIDKSIIDNIKRSAELSGVTPTKAQLKEFLAWHVEGIYADFHSEDLDEITAENFD